MMKNHHIAFWTQNIDALVKFYTRHFSGKLKFTHEIDDFKCTFLQLPTDVFLEFMTRTNLPSVDLTERVGYSHLSMEVESKEEVNRLTDYFIAQKVPLQKVKEQYDDGFYESSVLDPDGNIIEISYINRKVNANV